MMQNAYDVIVIGGGSAGYAAAIYSARARLSTLIVEKDAFGGQITKTDHIDNYPGVGVGINGYELAQKVKAQAELFGTESHHGTVVSVCLSDTKKTVTVDDGTVLKAKTVILCMGVSPRKLEVPGEDKFIGHGVSFCATCDGGFFRDKTVVIAGGGNTAVEDAMFLSRLCKQVYIVHRRNQFRAHKILVEMLEKIPNIEPIMEDTIAEVLGDTKLTGVRLTSGRELAVDGVFVAVGHKPNNEIIQGIIDLDENGYVDANENTHTGVPGVFVAGDLRKKPLHQIVTAVSDGAVAAYMAELYILNHED